MTLKVIHSLQTFSNAIRRTCVQHFTWFQLTVCLHGSSALAELLVWFADDLFWKRRVDKYRRTLLLQWVLPGRIVLIRNNWNADLQALSPHWGNCRTNFVLFWRGRLQEPFSSSIVPFVPSSDQDCTQQDLKFTSCKSRNRQYFIVCIEHVYRRHRTLAVATFVTSRMYQWFYFIAFFCLLSLCHWSWLLWVVELFPIIG